jgi:hypothetical protein
VLDATVQAQPRESGRGLVGSAPRLLAL